MSDYFKEISFYALANTTEHVLLSPPQFDKRHGDYTSHVIAKLPLGEYEKLKNAISPELGRISELLDIQFEEQKELESLRQENERLKVRDDEKDKNYLNLKLQYAKQAERIKELERELNQQRFNNEHNLSIDQKVSDRIKELEDKNLRLQASIDGLDGEVCTLIDERDEWEDMAGRLADEVASFFGEDIGEHTSANCPISNALEIIQNSSALSDELRKLEVDVIELTQVKLSLIDYINEKDKVIKELEAELSHKSSELLLLLTRYDACKETVKELEAELEEEKKITDKYADQENWDVDAVSDSSRIVNYVLFEKPGGTLARERQKQRKGVSE